MAASPLIQFRAIGANAENLRKRTTIPPGAEKDENRLLSHTGERDLERWYMLLPLVLPRFPMNEAMLMVDALNGFIVEPQLPDTVRMNIADAIAMDHLDKKWNVNGPGLLKKLGKLGPFELMAIADAVEQAWISDGYYQETATLQEKLIKIGLAEPDLADTIHNLEELLSYAQKQHQFGSIHELAQSLYSGETATVLLPDEQRSAALAWLLVQHEGLKHDPVTADAVKSIASQLANAIQRERDLERKNQEEEES